jgi:uncharacterized protein
MADSKSAARKGVGVRIPPAVSRRALVGGTVKLSRAIPRLRWFSGGDGSAALSWREPGGSLARVALADERYMLLTTFRRDGRPVSTPVWWVDLGSGNYGFWTSSTAGKVKRLAHTARVTVQPCNARGVVTEGSELLEASARVVSGPELEGVRTAVKAKYGFQAKIAKSMFKLTVGWRKKMPYADRAVIVTPRPAPSA